MDEAILRQQQVESSSSAESQAKLENQSTEISLKESVFARLRQQSAEATLRSVVRAKLLQNYAEAAQSEEPDLILTQQEIEVLWKEQPTPEIFPWRQNWGTEIKETLQWKTEVIISRDGSERRQLLRNRPRRNISYSLTLSDKHESLGLVNWLNQNLGRSILVPLLHQQIRCARDFVYGETFLFGESISELYLSSLQPLEKSSMLFEQRNYDPVNQGEILVVEKTGTFQRNYAVFGSTIEGDGLRLIERLARAIPANSLVFPCLEGIIKQAPSLSHAHGDVVEASIDIELSPPIYSYKDDGAWLPEEENAESFPTDEEFKFVPLILGWTEGNDWADSIQIGFEPLMENFDNTLAKAFELRVNKRSNLNLRRRFYAFGDQEIFDMRGMLDYLSGRLRPVFLDEQIHGIKLIEDCVQAQDVIRIENNNAATWLNGTKMLVARNPNGTFCVIKVASFHSTSDNVCDVALSEGIPIGLSKDAVITRVLYCRSQNDSIELIYRTDKIVELNLTFVALEEPILDTEITKDYWVPRQCE